jgi:hypothetical protein
VWLVPLCKAYRIFKAVGDNFAGELAKDPIRKTGVSYELAAASLSKLPILSQNFHLGTSRTAISSQVSAIHVMHRLGPAVSSHAAKVVVTAGSDIVRSLSGLGRKD